MVLLLRDAGDGQFLRDGEGRRCAGAATIRISLVVSETFLGDGEKR